MPSLRIMDVLKKRKLSQYRLAIMLGMSGKNVARLFRPDYNPRFDTLCRIAKALKCRVRDLIKE